MFLPSAGAYFYVVFFNYFACATMSGGVLRESENMDDPDEDVYEEPWENEDGEEGGFSEEESVKDVFQGHFEKLKKDWPNVAALFDSILSQKWDKRGTKMYDISSVLPFLHHFGREKNNRAFNMSKVVSYFSYLLGFCT